MSFAFSQENNESTYSYIDAFKTEFYNSPGTITRSASGKPGHGYWQNSADYDIDVRLDTINDNISGSQIIRYTNNSPDELNFVWLHVDQNLFKSDSRGNAVIPIIGSRNGSKGEILDGGFKISTVQIVSEKGRKKSYTNTEYEIYDTRMKILLSSPLKPNGGKLSLKIDFSFLSPQYGSDRMGVLKTKNGKLYTIAQWYPRMCVYDDLNGWNNLPYLGQGEFYLDYGDFKVNITAPSDHIVVCSGELLNAEEVYTSEQLSRWEEAENSNKTIMIRTAD